MDNSYGSADFKSHCLQIIDEVARTGQAVRVTKRGKPAVVILPDTADEPGPVYGLLRDSAVLKDDLFRTDEKWDADGK